MMGKLRNMTTIYLRRGDEFLLLFREGGKVVNHVYTGSAGGHFEPFELNDPTACVLREMHEEIGLTADEIEGLALRYITLRNVGGEVRQNYYFFATLKKSAPIDLRSNEGKLRLVNISKMMTLPMPFSAKFMLAHYLETGQYNDKLYGGIATEDTVVFTEMGEIYEKTEIQ